MLTKVMAGVAVASVLALGLVGKMLLNSYEHSGKLEQTNASLEAALDNQAQVMADYALDVQGQLEAYERANDYLIDNYQRAREEAERPNRALSEHDMEKLLREKPDLTIDRINAGTERLLMEVEAASRGATGKTGVADPAAAAAPRPD